MKIELRASKAYRFFLGGCDLEMAEIGRLLARHAPGQVIDKGLAWGAAYSDYAAEIGDAISAGLRPVAIELEDDMPRRWQPRRCIVVIDHHGKSAGADNPCALAQVIELLGLAPRAWTRRRRLIAANDIGHIQGLIEAGASPAEIVRIRAADRRAQGRTRADESEALRAIDARRSVGALTLVETRRPTSSVIADRLHIALGGPGYDNLLVVMPAELAFYGDGAIVKRLAKTFGGSWSGGALPQRGFWGAHASEDGGRQAMIDSISALAR